MCVGEEVVGETRNAGTSSGKSTRLHGSSRPLCPHMYASAAVSASSEAAPASRSATKPQPPVVRVACACKGGVRVNTPSSHGSLKTQAASMGAAGSHFLSGVCVINTNGGK